MSPDNSIAIIAIVVSVVGAVIGHLGFSVWWASKITTTLSFLQRAVHEITDELKLHKNNAMTKEEAAREFTKTSENVKALWTKMDDTRGRLEHAERDISYLKGENGK